ncbi:unnamed protein product [Fraxinus pennsylvanica]|uniref:mitogen-activated protein kinase kinase kinase n=1 Tax=Fraxinus pennsylvanica TaxID=56036 RepID=A0AAD2E6P5_9LAMI|nr:unnamed protein product [Fraxinus pennsylvanica]
MHWWRGMKSHADDSLVDGGGGRSPLKTSLFSRRSRAGKLQNLIDNDENSPARSSFVPMAAAQPSPQPLPLPEVRAFIEHDAKFDSSCQSYNVPLPSPMEAYIIVHRGDNEKRNRERERANQLNAYAIDELNVPKSRLAGKHVRRNSENCESWSSNKSTIKQNDMEMSSDIDKTSFPISAPSSPYSFPHLSPTRNSGDFLVTHYTTPPGAFQVWSAPEMPHLDTHLGTRLSYQLPPEKTSSNVDNSPLHSPRASSFQLAISPNKPATPLYNKISPETSSAWRESNAQANLHPLPLPPGVTPSFPVAAKPELHETAIPSHPTPMSPLTAKPEFHVTSMPSQTASTMFPLTAKPEFSATAMPLQPTSISLVAAKPELMLIKGQWQKGKLIGRGTFGSVYIASNRVTGALCAMKEVEILPDDPKSAECVRQLEQVGDRFYIYLEYVHPGSINKFIHDHCGAITESVVRNFTRHILCGLAYLHSTKTIHRDIKGANLLVDANGVVKLADFGMAKHLTGYAANLSLKGSPYWMAPELLQSVMQVDASSDLALAVDIWSLGCTIIEMFNGKPPWSEYEGAAALFKVLKDTPPIPETMSADGKEFLHCCFRRKPTDRPTARMLLEHPFVKYSHQPDALSCDEIRLTGNVQCQRGQPSYKFEQVPVSSDTQILKGKLAINEIGQRSHHKRFNFANAPLHSPRSTLRPFPVYPRCTRAIAKIVLAFMQIISSSIMHSAIKKL